MNETILQACADYHRAKAIQHKRIAAVPAYTNHQLLRAELHESWRAAIEAAIVELRGKQYRTRTPTTMG